MDFKKNTGLRIAVWPEPSNTGTMLGDRKRGEGISVVPKVAVREECFPYFPDETEGADWSTRVVDMWKSVLSAPGWGSAILSGCPLVMRHLRAFPAVQFHALSRDREAGSRTCQEPTYL